MTYVSDVQRREQFEATVLSVYAPLQRYLHRRSDPATADDVLGDVLLVMWRRADEIPSHAATAWCYGVARGCLANAVRGAQRQQRLVRRLGEEADRRPAVEFVGGVDENGDGELDMAMATLPADDRELLRLWAWEELPPREIAVVLGISANAASIRLHRALRRLRKLLADRKNVVGDGHLAQHQDTEAPQ